MLFAHWLRNALARRPERSTQPVRRARPRVESLEDRLAPATFTVLNTNDSGADSLRQAILDANANPGADLIAFNIGGGGVQTIAPTSALPTITDAVTIDGTTQPGFSGSPIIELNGASAGTATGLVIKASNSTVRSLVINSFATGEAGIWVWGTGVVGNWVHGCYIGTDVSSTQARPNFRGVQLGAFAGDAPQGTIVGTNGDGSNDAAERNIISGNIGDGIRIRSGTTATPIPFALNSIVAGNYIGTDVTGTVALGNGAGGTGVGISIGGGAQGNRIGTDGNGVADAAERNVISGGILIGNPGTNNNTVAGNYIGTNATGTAALGNGRYGIVINTGAQGNRVGGAAAALSNTIAFHTLGGVGIRHAGTTGNRVQGNSIHSNGDHGIDLTLTPATPPAPTGDGVTSNDSGDADSGPNKMQNYPVITSAVLGASTQVAGRLNSTANTTFTLDFYANAMIDPSDFGEGQRYLGSAAVTTDGSGNVTFNVSLAAATVAGELITATATDPDGNTSEFSGISRVAGRVFEDKDNDGAYEPDDGEVGIGGVAVQLFDQTSGAFVASQATAADGSYLFLLNRGAGTYKLVAAQPVGFLDGRETAGTVGGTVDNTQDSQQITDIILGDPGTNSRALDYLFAEIRPSQAQGLVWSDFNNNGQVDFGEKAIAGVTVELTGQDDRGNAVNRTATTDANGIYAFIDVRPSNAAGYTIREVQPVGYLDGLDVVGQVNGLTVGDASVNDTFSAVVLPRPGSLAENYNFAERPTSGGGVTGGQTATIGYWQNNNGQNLINALNGGSTSTQLGNWLATTFANMYGAGAGANNLAGKSNAEVAAFYKTLFARTAATAAGGGPAKMDAQVLATAFAVYVTNQSLAGTTAAAYGFQVSENGVGARSFNVGSNGAAFGVANNTSVSVLDLLLAVNSRSRNGLLYDLDDDGDANDTLETSYRTMANNVFSAINEAGDI